ncbi:MAG: hypothetical protein AAF151_15100 [Cyanobacteria bacterium J06656_5]
MENNQLQPQNSDSVQEFDPVELNTDQQSPIDNRNEDGDSNNGGDLALLFVQELSVNALAKLHGGRISHDGQESYGDGGGRTGGDWIVNHNQTIVSIGK